MTVCYSDDDDDDDLTGYCCCRIKGGTRILSKETVGITTAAKSIVFGRVSIDMLAGPSEVLVFADDSADPGTVAADMLLVEP